LTLCHQLAAAVIDLTSPLEDFYVISPEIEALPMPPWLLDGVYEDLICNPHNSPVHSPVCFNIWFMTSEPSSSARTTPLASPAGGNHTRAEITPYDLLYSHHFQCDEEILEELHHPDSPWDALHHRALFLPQEALMPPNQNPIYTVETKDFIPYGPIDWLNNPIPTPNAFEEGNLANISPP
jgi:hypothetical protein